MTTLIAPAAPPDTSEPPGESRFLIRNVSWENYEKLLEIIGDGLPRVTYDNGTVELMSPGPLHEQYGHILGRVVTILLMELDIPAKGQGSTTIRNRMFRKGLEPDECFYLASLPVLQGRNLNDLKAQFPPPDLAIEIEETNPLLPKLPVYAALGVPEVWWHTPERGLVILLLGPDGQYVESDQSRVFPFLPLAAFREQLATYDPEGETRWFRSYRDWVRGVVAPLYQV